MRFGIFWMFLDGNKIHKTKMQQKVIWQETKYIIQKQDTKNKANYFLKPFYNHTNYLNRQSSSESTF